MIVDPGKNRPRPMVVSSDAAKKSDPIRPNHEVLERWKNVIDEIINHCVSSMAMGYGLQGSRGNSNDRLRFKGVMPGTGRFVSDGLKEEKNAEIKAQSGGGLAAFRKFSLPNAITSKIYYLQYPESFQVPFSASICGKCFSPHFPQTENGPACAEASAGRRGFDSRCHIKLGDIITRVSSPDSCLRHKGILNLNMIRETHNLFMGNVEFCYESPIERTQLKMNVTKQRRSHATHIASA